MQPSSSHTNFQNEIIRELIHQDPSLAPHAKNKANQTLGQPLQSEEPPVVRDSANAMETEECNAECARATKQVANMNDKTSAPWKDVLKETVEHVESIKTAGERRPTLAAFANHQKNTVEQTFGLQMSHDEWHNIQLHARFPGKFKPVQVVKSHRTRIPGTFLKKFLSFLENPGNLQRCAFGTRMISLCNSSMAVELPNVRQKAL